MSWDFFEGFDSRDSLVHALLCLQVKASAPVLIRFKGEWFASYYETNMRQFVLGRDRIFYRDAAGASQIDLRENITSLPWPIRDGKKPGEITNLLFHDLVAMDPDMEIHILRCQSDYKGDNSLFWQASKSTSPGRCLHLRHLVLFALANRSDEFPPSELHKIKAYFMGHSSRDFFNKVRADKYIVLCNPFRGYVIDTAGAKCPVRIESGFKRFFLLYDLGETVSNQIQAERISRIAAQKAISAKKKKKARPRPKR